MRETYVLAVEGKGKMGSGEGGSVLNPCLTMDGGMQAIFTIIMWYGLGGRGKPGDGELCVTNERGERELRCVPTQWQRY